MAANISKSNLTPNVADPNPRAQVFDPVNDQSPDAPSAIDRSLATTKKHNTALQKPVESNDIAIHEISEENMSPEHEQEKSAKNVQKILKRPSRPRRLRAAQPN